MKIVYIANSFVPSRAANSVHVMKMCQALAQLGHEVELVARLPEDGAAVEEDALWRQYGIHTSFRLKRLLIPRRLPRLRYAARAVAHAARVRADLVYTRNSMAAPLAAWRGLATIYEPHGARLTRESRVLFRLLCRSRNFRKLVMITEALKQDFLARFRDALDPGVIQVLPDGVDLERFDDLPDPATARQRLGWEATRFTVGYAGHLYAGRGIELILSLAERLPQFRFLIVGGAEQDLARYRAEAAARALDQVRFAGYVPNGDLPRYLAACEVLLMPYQRRVAAAGVQDTAAWMSPMKMFEYMATGRLIVSSDLPVLREVLGEDNAALCPPEDIDCWQAALERAARDATWRRQLGAQALADVRHYTWLRRAKRALADL